MYSHKFTSAFGEEPNEIWVKMMTGVTGAHMAEALKLCAEIFPLWPPGAAQFRAMCFGKDPRNTDKEGNELEWQLNRVKAGDRAHEKQRIAQERWLNDDDAVAKNKQAHLEHRKKMKELFCA